MAVLNLPSCSISEMARGVLRVFLLVVAMTVAVPRVSAQINTDQVMRIGRNSLYFEDYVLSIQYFNAVIGAKPWLAQPYFFRGLAKFYLDDLNGAADDVSKALERNPFLGDAFELRGVINQNLGRTEEAVADYDRALAMAPENRNLLFNKALALEEIKEYDRAEEAFSTLLRIFPRYSEGYLGRAKLLMAKKDMVAARRDIDHALEIDPNAVNGYIMRADIAINSAQDYQTALEDMNHAIKLQPKYAGFYINRAFLRHELDDYNGAMDDYDYALQLDPENTTAMFNRAMLRAEVHDYNRAIEDLNYVEQLNGSDFRTLYNRALLSREIGDYEGAIRDVNRVIDAYPDLAAAYFLRYDIKRTMGDRTAWEDQDHSLALAKKKVQVIPGTEGEPDVIAAAEDGEGGESQEAVARRFTSLITVADNAEMEQEFNNRSIRGRVQDRNSQIELEPMFTVTYYTSPTELKQSSDFLREVTEMNNTRMLRFLLQVANREPRLDDEEEISRHFASIDYYTSYISTHTPRPIDYFGRGMDYMMVHNYQEALADFIRATELDPRFTLAWFMRAVSRYRDLKTAPADADQPSQAHQGQFKGFPGVSGELAGMRLVLADLDHTLELSPEMAVAWYDKGVVLAEMKDYEGAMEAFNQAIRIRPAFGEAYFNRGYVEFRRGHRQAGQADLSRAGELGVVPSYNLLKRMGRR
ncbi:MAG: tetratricopeptide repeat protein [Clostridium sp.]|nr:tetratricopeptide repeat protein [Clostridium sp.]